MTMRFSLHDDMSGGFLFDDLDGSLPDGSTITLYGIRYEVGLDYGDGASLTRIGIDDFPHHTTLHDIEDYRGDITQPDNDLPPKYTTVREWADHGSDFDLDPETPITVFADNTWCVGHYDGNQTTESLI